MKTPENIFQRHERENRDLHQEMNSGYPGKLRELAQQIKTANKTFDLFTQNTDPGSERIKLERTLSHIEKEIKSDKSFIDYIGEVYGVMRQMQTDNSLEFLKENTVAVSSIPDLITIFDQFGVIDNHTHKNASKEHFAWAENLWEDDKEMYLTNKTEIESKLKSLTRPQSVQAMYNQIIAGKGGKYTPKGIFETELLKTSFEQERESMEIPMEKTKELISLLRSDESLAGFTGLSFVERFIKYYLVKDSTRSKLDKLSKADAKEKADFEYLMANFDTLVKKLILDYKTELEIKLDRSKTLAEILYLTGKGDEVLKRAQVNANSLSEMFEIAVTESPSTDARNELLSHKPETIFANLTHSDFLSKLALLQSIFTTLKDTVATDEMKDAYAISVVKSPGEENILDGVQGQMLSKTKHEAIEKQIKESFAEFSNFWLTNSSPFTQDILDMYRESKALKGESTNIRTMLEKLAVACVVVKKLDNVGENRIFVDKFLKNLQTIINSLFRDILTKDEGISKEYKQREYAKLVNWTRNMLVLVSPLLSSEELEKKEQDIPEFITIPNRMTGRKKKELRSELPKIEESTPVQEERDVVEADPYKSQKDIITGEIEEFKYNHGGHTYESILRKINALPREFQNDFLKLLIPARHANTKVKDQPKESPRAKAKKTAEPKTPDAKKKTYTTYIVEHAMQEPEKTPVAPKAKEKKEKDWLIPKVKIENSWWRTKKLIEYRSISRDRLSVKDFVSKLLILTESARLMRDKGETKEARLLLDAVEAATSDNKGIPKSDVENILDMVERVRANF